MTVLDAPRPTQTFTFQDMQLPAPLRQAVDDLNYTTPTEIQGLALPPARQGKDVLGTAATGSGKTVAFLLPVVERLLTQRSRQTRALVLAPTRELAAQIEEVARALIAHTHLKVVSIFGGVSQGPQQKALRAGTDIVIATPGRLLDHIGQGNIDFRALEVLVLDEADRMLDLGFLPDIRRVLRALPTERQTLLFSATMPDSILKLAGEFQHHPVRVGVRHQGRTNDKIAEALFPVHGELKAKLLIGLLADEEIGMDSVLVFTRTKHRANRLTEQLVNAGISAERIHGNRSQNARTEALAGFKSGKYRVLVATDIAARGIDIDSLGHVVNFDVPVAAEDYVHRAGRTARAGKSGTAFTLVSPQEEDEIRSIERFTKRTLTRRTLEGFDYHAKVEGKLEQPRPAQGGRGGRGQQGGGGGRSTQARAQGNSGGQSAQPRRQEAPRPSRPAGNDIGGGRVGPQPARRRR
ncbi:RNA helicase [Deinococcus irradiatisoli]|uniref:RNA helicase n=1 Tax=Deinococcus irradiatisoli TaxID=2202254 RepID=A0A2Z3JBD6_9DEIO|nr:DEAD/DEAH box helicase [Deinococcus irradiatisoli]AWN22275.1 RNA helicase [Deinococcus irradiatisoli]